ncbi:MAG TPA: cellulase family glycosylhydrolase, partial [Bryobacteraceae bacterium]|nr:cellulase family glycosylhydrolase [Bryobacteraceae bacterium]
VMNSCCNATIYRIGARREICMCVMMVAAMATAAASQASAGLTVKNGVLLKDGRAYRGIGVNYFDVFYHLLKNPDDGSVHEDFKRLRQRGIPFVRFAANGFWPRDNELYFRDKSAYFQLLDSVVHAAEQTGIGLVPSLFWNWSTVPDLMHEPLSAWGDRQSRTHRFLRQYTSEMVSRYRSSTAIWMWEFGNEYDDQIDFPENAPPRAPVVPELGTPASRSQKDDLTLESLLTAFREFVRTVRKLDRDRAISSGNDIPRADAFHRHKTGAGDLDTRAQWRSMLLKENSPFPVISIHVYLNRSRPFFSDGPLDPAAAIEVVSRIARSAKKPVFAGEFGPTGKDRDAGVRQFRALLRAIETSGVPLAAVWNFGPRMPFEGVNWNIGFDNENAWMLDEIAAANARMQQQARDRAPLP